MASLECKYCNVSLHVDHTRDELICFECGNTYPNDMVIDGNYINVFDEKMYNQNQRILSLIREKNMDIHTSLMDLDEDSLYKLAFSLFQSTPSLSYKEASVVALCHQRSLKTIRDIISITHVSSDKIMKILHGSVDPEDIYLKSTMEHIVDLCSFLNIPTKHIHQIRSKIQPPNDYVNTYVFACVMLVKHVPNLEEIFHMDIRFTKKIYTKYK
jgi:transcription initiation factor TFIIIB Brf1 subunit/transcription initiation factor TFIIB